MTNEEALKMFECGKRDTECKVKKELYEVASEAIKKQIKRKVEFVFRKGFESVKCPACYHVVYNEPYCWYCGQALDWSGEK